jgi:hypothetical protein
VALPRVPSPHQCEVPAGPTAPRDRPCTGRNDLPAGWLCERSAFGLFLMSASGQPHSEANLRVRTSLHERGMSQNHPRLPPHLAERPLSGCASEPRNNCDGRRADGLNFPELAESCLSALGGFLPVRLRAGMRGTQTFRPRRELPNSGRTERCSRRCELRQTAAFVLEQRSRCATRGSCGTCIRPLRTFGTSPCKVVNARQQWLRGLGRDAG